MRAHKADAFHPLSAEQIQASIDLAIAEGRHSREPKFVCSGCGELVDGIYWVSPQNSRVRLCRDCDPNKPKDPRPLLPEAMQ